MAKSERYVLDAHFDILGDVAFRRRQGERRVIERLYRPSFIEGGIDGIAASLFVDSRYLPEAGLREALSQIASLYHEVEESPCLSLCTSAESLRKAKEEGKTGFLLSFEGVEPVFDIDSLALFYRLGVRGAGLCWSRPNMAADGCDFTLRRKKGGLTAFGEDLVREICRLGMFIDVSHLSDEGVEDLMALIPGPFIASHSNSRAVNPVNRNLPDEYLREIGRRGGVAGLNACSIIVSQDDPSWGKMADHLDHMLYVMGEDHVGFGFDFCDAFFQSGSSSPLPGGNASSDVVKGHSAVPSFLSFLSDRGYPDSLLGKVAGENWLAFYERIGLE